MVAKLFPLKHAKKPSRLESRTLNTAASKTLRPSFECPNASEWGGSSLAWVFQLDDHERRPPAPKPPSFLRGECDRSVGSAMARGLSALLSAVEEPNAV